MLPTNKATVDNSGSGLTPSKKSLLGWKGAVFGISNSTRTYLALSYTLGFILPLAFAFGNFFNNEFRYLVPIMYAIVVALAPPYQASAVLVWGCYLGGVLPGMGFATLAILATIYAKSAYAGYLVLIGLFLLGAPLATGPFAGITKTLMFVFVLISIYAYMAVQDLALTGLLFSIPVTAGPASLENLLCVQPAKFPLGGFGNRLQHLFCEAVTGPNPFAEALKSALLADKGVSFPWPTDFVALLPDGDQLNSYFSGTELNIRICCGGFFQVSISPGMWIIRVIWNFQYHDFSVFGGICTALAVAFACASIVYIFFPPHRLASLSLQKQLVNVLVDWSAMYGTTLTSESNEYALQMRENISMMDQMASLAMLEPYWGWPGLGVSTFSQWKPLLASYEDFLWATRLHAMVYVGRGHKTEQENRTGTLVRPFQDMLICVAEMNAARPNPNGKFILRMFKERIELVKDHIDSGTSAWCKGCGGDPESEADILYAHSVNELTNKAHSLCAESYKMLELKDCSKTLGEGHVRGLLKSLLSLPVVGLLPYVRWAHALTSLCRAKRNRLSFARWVSNNDHIYQLQLVIAWAIASFPAIFFPSIRDWLLNPVGVLPAGALGKWLVLPVTVLLQPSVEGTMKKSLLRLIGTLVGVLCGYVVGITLEKSIPGGCALLGAIFFASVFTGINTNGEMSVFGGFHGSYGYACQLVAYTSTIVALESVFSCSEVANPDSLCQYSVGNLSLVRLTAQSIGIVVSVIVTHLIFPLFGSIIAREKLHDILRAQAALVAEDTDSKQQKLHLDQVKAIMKEGQSVYVSTTILSELPAYRPDPLVPSLALATMDMYRAVAMLESSPLPDKARKLERFLISAAAVIRNTGRVPTPMRACWRPRYFTYSHCCTERQKDSVVQVFDDALKSATELMVEDEFLRPFLRVFVSQVQACQANVDKTKV